MKGRYPKAEWLSWKYRSPDGVPTYYKDGNKPIAVVLHIAEGWQRTARQWAMAGHHRASRHFSIGRDGEVLQHLELTDGGYHAGISIAQGLSTPPIWPLWQGARKNVNHYTIGIEHEGFHNEPWPERQRLASRDLCTWLASELGIPLPASDPMVVGALGPGDRYLLHYPPHAAIDRINRVNDFAPVPQRATFYDWLKNGDDMTEDEVRTIVREEVGMMLDLKDISEDDDDRLREVMNQREYLRLIASSDTAVVKQAYDKLKESKL